jgi:hypothetical protein
MLNQLIGRTPVEVGKSVGLLALAVLTTIALVQVSVERSHGNQTQQGRSEVVSTAREFAIALTTYDYAHPDVQWRRLSSVAAPTVIEKARGAEPDLLQYQASSLGESPEIWLQDFDGRSGQVLVRTHSIVQSVYSPPGTKASGLMSCRVEQLREGWRVTDYRWLTPATETAPS